MHAQVHRQLGPDGLAVHVLAPLHGHRVEVDCTWLREDEPLKQLVLFLAVHREERQRRAHRLAQRLLVGCELWLGIELDVRYRIGELGRMERDCPKALRRRHEVAGIAPSWVQQHAVVELHVHLQRVDKPSVEMAEHREAVAAHLGDSVRVAMAELAEDGIPEAHAHFPTVERSPDALVRVLDHVRTSAAVEQRDAVLVDGRLALGIELLRVERHTWGVRGEACEYVAQHVVGAPPCLHTE
mmetsp:Transcript_7883/g.20185  ORF Transcript_7883/g.20185 Transcript_7883/m.20185 type:complete len:241 (-) Transcript_7883:402-1124(-)